MPGNARTKKGKLRRCYGFFKCGKCRRQWESSHVYCEWDSDEAVYTQDCQSCHLPFLPYKIEGIKCRYCGETRELCECDKDEHHIDPLKPHRSDLCGKCRAGDPCTSSELLNYEVSNLSTMDALASAFVKLFK